jgi:glycerophosphoryl diester phosphodiesterase
MQPNRHLYPRNLAHRGARLVAPENTLAAFCAAERLGADGVELDVWQCLSGELVVTHDDDLAVWSDGQGRVTTTSLAALRELDFGRHFSAAFAGERIPTLEEVIAALAPTMFINIELKTLSLQPIREVAGVAAIIARHNLYARTIVSSFNPWVLRALQRQDPRIARGLLSYYRRPFIAGVYGWRWAQATAIHPAYDLLTANQVIFSRQQGLPINTWTVNTATAMRQCIEWQVAGIITDDPALLRQVLQMIK